MKRIIILSLLLFLICPIPGNANVARPVKEVFEVIIKKCTVCKKILTSPVAERLVQKGIISSKNADVVAKLLNNYGDEGLRLIDNYGDPAIRIFKSHGDEGINYLKKYGDDYLNQITKNIPEVVNKILKHPKGMIFLKESPETAKYFTKYGDDFLSYMNRNPLAIDTIKRTGLSPNVLSKLTEPSVSWLEVYAPKLAIKNSKDAKAMQDIISKYGDNAVDFIRKNWDILWKVGALTVVAANFETVFAGGRDVLIAAVEGTEEAVKEIGKETVREFTTGYGVILVLGIAIIFFIYRYFSNKKTQKTV
jgi:hypothetical protein